GHLGDRPPVPAEPCVQPAGQQVENHEPDVVPVARVLPAGVAQPDHEPALPFGRCGTATGQRAHQARDQDSAEPDSPASPSPSAPSSCSEVGDRPTTATTVSGSVTSSAPAGRVICPAVTRSPASRPSTEASRWSGRWVASALIKTRSCSSITSVPRAASPTSVTGTST